MRRNPFRRCISPVILLITALSLTLPHTPAHAQTPVNLIQNGGFETDLTPWDLCGAAQRIDAPVHSGSHALRLGSPVDDSCNTSFPDLAQIASQPITFPANPAGITLEFWMRIPGTDNITMELGFGEDPKNILDIRFVDALDTVGPPGWTLYRTRLAQDDVAALQGKTLYFVIGTRYHLSADYDTVLYIDDVAVYADDVSTPASPLPAALQGNGARPIVLLQPNPTNPNGLAVTRIDTDGSKPLAIYPGLANLPLNPLWSSDGRRILVLDNALYPEGAGPSTAAIVTQLSTMNPDGSDLKLLYQTYGLPAQPSNPPGCSPGPGCTSATPALDQRIVAMDGSPDGSAIALSICTENRYANGSTSDSICRLERISATTGLTVAEPIDGVTKVSWGANQRLLYSGQATFANEAYRGIWELDLARQPLSPTLILPGPGSVLQNNDYDAKWAPHGWHFATVRATPGHHGDAGNPAEPYRIHYAIMLFDRQDLANPRQLTLSDAGRDMGGLSWSPDGRYLLYALYLDAGGSDVWWLDVETGATGPMTTNHASIGMDWQPTAAPPNPNLRPGAFIPLILR